MQSIIIYLRAGDVAATVVDEYNQTAKTIPAITRGMRANLCLRPIDSEGNPIPAGSLDYVGWDFVLAHDWNTSTDPQIRVQTGITVSSVTVGDKTFSQITIPLTETNTTQLVEALGSSASVKLGAELAGFESGEPDPGFLIQFDVNVRNRRGTAGTGTPEPVGDGSYSAVQIDVLLDTKADADHNHDDAYAPLDHTHSELHEHANKSLLDSYDQENTDLADAVSKKHEHANKSTLDAIPDHSNASTGQVIKKQEDGSLAFEDESGGSGSGEVVNEDFSGENWSENDTAIAAENLKNEFKERGLQYSNRASVLTADDNGKPAGAIYAPGFADTEIDAYGDYLKAAWKFNDGEISVDSIGQNTWVNNNNVTGTAEGKSGYAGVWGSSASSYLSQTPGDDLKPTGKVTLAMWFKPTSVINCYLFHTTNGGNDVLWLRYQSGGFEWYVTQSNGTRLATSSAYSLTPGEWYHLACVADGTHLKLYVNGTQIGPSTSYDGTISTEVTVAYLGAGNNSGPSGFSDAVIDEAYLWNGAGLSATAIDNLYNSGAGKAWSTANNAFGLLTTLKLAEIIEAITGEGVTIAGLNIKNGLIPGMLPPPVTLTIPTDPNDDALHLQLELSENADFSDPVETVDTSVAQTNVELFDGTEWIGFPSAGAGTPYYGFRVGITLSNAAAGQKYYLRHRWYDGTDYTDWASVIYPAFSL